MIVSKLRLHSIHYTSHRVWHRLSFLLRNAIATSAADTSLKEKKT